MTDYKDTLNLPKTDFPMKASLAQREPKMLAFWNEMDLYGRLRELGKDRSTFILHDGPPYANATIHLGTTMNKVLKDIVIKSKTLSGFNAPYVPGWDCHGMPIELKVEKKVGKAGAKLSHREFRQACRDFAKKQVDIQMADFKRLGVLGDWDNPYLTMNFRYEANVIRALSKMIENGHLHRGEKPVHWCMACSSALAEAEVEYKDKTSPSIDVAFDVVDVAAVLTAFGLDKNIEKIRVPIWTTTPWTLPANQAVSLHPALDYVLVECDLHGQNIYLILAKDLLDDVMQRYQAEDYQVIAQTTGETLEGIRLQHPFLDRIVPITLGDHVTTEAGTGNVHTAPAHGQDDYAVSRRYNLAVDNPVDSRSCFIESVPIVGGLHVTKANEPIIAVLKNSEHLLHETSLTHSYPHCWRHKTPLIFRATPQWFISMEKNRLRELAIKAISTVKWIPAWGKNRITKMMEGRPDWCISRQRSWGTPLPLFIHKETQMLHPDTLDIIEKVADGVEQAGIDYWFETDFTTLLGPDAEHYDKVTDILDVWFDAGSSHTCVLEERSELHAPADLYLEGSDQHRGWFQTSLLTSLAIRGAAPYKTVLTHGYVVDAKGHKMSKSVGNVIAPMEVINRLGADVLRLWAAACDHTGDVNFSDEILRRMSDAYRRIRNTARFLLANLNGFNPETDQVAASDLLELDRWAIATTQQLQIKMIEAYEHFHFQSIFQLIHNFCSVEMGSFYLDIIKDRQYTARADGLPRRSGQTAMFHIIQALVRWMAPILSFTAEEIWQHMPGVAEESVFLTTWYEAFPAVEQTQAERDNWQWVMQVRDEVNKVLEAHRKQGDIGSALDAEVTVYGEHSMCEKLSHLGDELRFIFITSGANVLPLEEKPDDAQKTEMDDLWVRVRVSSHSKCERCWQRCADVGNNKEHATICQRCIDNVVGEGEQRKFA